MRDADKELSVLTRRRDRLHDDLVAAATDHGALATLGRELAEVDAQIAVVEERWLALASELDTP
jgi:hypothetical protein